MAGKKINELTQAANVADSDLFIVETANGTQSVPYSSIKSEGVSFNGTGANSIKLGNNTNSNGSTSIAIGDYANSNGTYSIAIGDSTISDSYESIAIGSASGSNGVAIGSRANACNFKDIAIGFGSKCSDNNNSSWGNSISIGVNSVTYGSNSIAVGIKAYSFGDSISIGTESATEYSLGTYNNIYDINNIAIGAYSKATGEKNCVSIGPYAQTSNANSIQLGDAANLSSITAKVPITTTSDERDKTDITEIEDSALEFLNKVKAIRYVFNGRKLYIDNKNLSDEEREKLNTYGMCDYDKEAHAQGTKKGSRMRVGVSAQNIQQALIDVFGDSGYANLVNDNLFDYNPDDIPDGVESQLAVNYEGFIPFLIKAVQELDARVKELENK